MKKFVLVFILIFSMTFVIQRAIANAEMDEDGHGTIEFFEIDNIPDDGDYEEVDGYVPDNMDRTIFGYNGLTEINYTSSYPYSAIAHMDVTAECGDTWRGTAFLVGRNVVMTAAHCLYCEDHQKWADQITLYFGYKNAKNYVYRYSGSWRGHIANTNWNSRQYDWGYLILDSNVGDTTGWFGLSTRSDSSLKSERVTIAGFPDNGSKPIAMKYDTGYIDALSEYILNYTIDTLPGTSGSPIFDRNNYVVGINVAHNSYTNIGVRIRNQMLEKIKADGGKLGSSINTPTATPRPSFRPTATPYSYGRSSCPGAAGPRLSVGGYAYICASGGVWLKDKPGYGTLIHFLPPNTRLKVLSGPECVFYDAINYKGERVGDQQYHYFWYVNVPSTGETGWIAEGQDSESWYYLCPTK